MGNALVSTKLIAREALPILADNLVMPNLCYKDFSNDFARQGDTILVRKPARFIAAEFTTGTTVNTQDINEESVEVKLDKLATVDVDIEAVEHATNLEDLTNRVIKPAAVALAEKINADGLGMYKYIPASVGTAGTTPDGLDDIANVRKALNIAKAPLQDRNVVWDPEADAKMTQIGNLIKVCEAGSPRGLREAEIGRVFGMGNWMSQGVAAHTTGAAGTPLVDLSGGYTAGATQIHIDGLSAAAKVGDRFTLAGDSTQYVIVAAGTLSTADQDITIFPGLAKNTADNTALTFVSSYTANLAFQKNAIAFVTRPLIAPSGADSYTTSYNGISLRVVRDYDFAYKREKLSVDVLYGYKAVYPELGCVCLG